MDLEISVGPSQIALHQGNGVLITERDGQISWPSDKGLYFFDTRLISSWSIYANGETWDLLNAGNIAHYAARVFLTNRAIRTEDGDILPRTVGLVLSRSIGGGVHEDLDLVNHGMKPVRFNLEIAIRCDFADLFEVKSGHILRRGRITTEWSDKSSQLRTIYLNRDFCREVTILTRQSGSRLVYANGRISFDIELQPGVAWHSCLLYELGDGKVRLPAPDHCIAVLARHLKTAEGCLEWIENCGDRDGDGFQEYATRSPVGYENQSWKDSGDCVVYPDGSLVKGPKALCELQGYVYDAWIRMAEIFDELGKADRARDLRDKAASLFRRFNDVFWDEASGFYAYALDGDKKKVLTVASNPGHCLWSGIVPADRAGRVVKRLMEPDMWSGWGIRTLSANHPAFNPYSYQNGAVWPHDNGIIAMGFRRYGFAEEAARIARDVSGAASYFMLHQVPELYSGVQRDPTNFPVQYLGANVPQAWAAGSCFAFLQAILGFQPDAPRGRLYIDPLLPAWLPDLTVIDLQVGKQNFDLRFWRDGENTRWEVLKGDHDAVVGRSYASGSNLATDDDAAFGSGPS